jgi:ABC-type oligopeptide transport system substrate-binding subunit
MHADLASVLYDKCEIDVYMMDDPSLLRTPPPDTVRVPLLSTYWLGINAQKPYLNLALRHAISHAIDREKAVAGLVPVTRPAFGLLPPDLPGAVAPGDPLAKDFPTFDMAAAKQEVAASGYDGRELTLLVSSGNSFLPEPGIAEAIRGQLATVGVKVRVVPSANLNDDAKLMQHDLLLKRTGADYAHPETFMSVWKRGGHNFTSWDQLDGGAGIDKLMQLTDQGAVELDPAAMRPIYVQAQKLLLVDDAVVVPIYYPDRYFRKRPWVAGLEINPFNFFTMRTLHLATTEPSH